jgi:hypothetical protein
MKITIISKAVFAVAMMFSLSSFASDKKENRETNVPNKMAFDAGVFQIGHSNKVKLAVDNSTDERLRVVLYDKTGRTYYNEMSGKRDKKYRQVFDLEGMTDGTYYFELSAGDQKITKEVAIETNSERVISFQ